VPESFDPYFEWLGIESGGRPPHHYCLLGLECRESNPEAIARAADAAMARLRRVRPGARLAEWSRLLDQLRAVKVCLLNPASKAAYDASLADPPSAASSGPHEPVLATPPTDSAAATTVEERPGSPFPVGYSQPPTYAAPGAAASPPPTVVPVSQAEPLLAEFIPAFCGAAVPAAGAGETPAPQVIFGHPPSTPAPAESWTGPLIAGLLVLIVGVGGALGYVLYQRGTPAHIGNTTDVAQYTAATSQSPATPAQQPTPPTELLLRKKVDAAPRRVISDGDTFNFNDKKRGETPRLPSTDFTATETTKVTQNPAPQPEPPKSEPAQPNPEAEKPKPTVDAKKTAAFVRAVIEARTAMSERDLASARKHLKTAAANAQSPEDAGQIDRLDTMVENLTQFWNGIRVSAAKLQPTEEIVINNEPIVVVESGRDYLTVRAAGRIRRYQVETMPTPLVRAIVDQSFGKDAGSKAIIGTFLAVDPDGNRALAKKYWQEAAKAGIDSEKLLHELDGTASAGPAAGPKLDPPTDKARLDAAGQAVRDKFKSQYDAATSLVKKAELARELLARAPGTENGDARFVMFREAKDLAVAAGQPALACDVVDQLARHYTVDPLGLKAAVLEEGGKNARGLSSQRDIAQRTLALVEQAVGEGRLDEAGRLAAVALDAARKSNNAMLMRQATVAGQQIQTLQKQGGKKK